MRIRVLVAVGLAPVLLTLPPLCARYAWGQDRWEKRDSLEVAIPGDQVPSIPAVGIDDSGRMLAVWSRFFVSPGAIYWSRFTPEGGWGPRQTLDLAGIADRVYGIEIAVNASGSAYAAWFGHAGLYAAAYDPALGWKVPVTIRSGPNPFLEFAQALNVGIDENGAGLIVWNNPNQDSIFYATSTAGTTWTAPQSIFNASIPLGSLSFDSNRSGEAVLLWERHPQILSPWTIYAARYHPASGWEASALLFISPTYHYPNVSMNDSGSAVATWTDYDTHFSNPDIYQRRCGFGQAWEDTEFVGNGGEAVVDLSQNGDEVLAWKRAATLNVVARRWRTDSGWQGEEVLQHFAAGDAFGILDLKLDARGNGFAVWSTPFAIPQTETRRLLREEGWEPIVVFGDGGHSTTGGRLTLNDAAGALAYTEAYDVFDGQYYNTYEDLLVSRFTEKATPVLISHVSTEVTAEGVRLRWYSPDARWVDARVLRQGTEGKWTPIGTPVREGRSTLAFMDATVDPGKRYGYRLMVVNGVGERQADEVWVDVPSLAFALEPIRPQPAPGSRFALTFVLPDTRSTRLEVLDVSGRRRWSHDVGALGPGRHTIVVEAGARTFAPGIYFVRLVGSGGVRVRTLIIE